MLGAIALAVGAGRAIAGAVQGRNDYRRRRSYIQESFGLATKRLGRQQANITQGHEESLVARGLNQGGSAGNTLAAGDRDDLRREFASEQKDLQLQREQAVADNRSAYSNAIMGAISSGVETGVGVYNAGKALQGLKSAPAGSPVPSAAPAPTEGSAVGIPGAFGVDAVDPLGAAGSAWNRSVTGVGQPNFAFNTGRA